MSSSQRDTHTNTSFNPHEEDHLLGMELGSYRLVERLGEGASAVVYRAEHVRLGIPYAIKILHPIIATRQGMRERFLREAQAAGSLRHENVVFIADFAIDTKIGPYMVMEFLEGETLQSVLEREGALPIERVRNIAKQICKALSVAHDIGIIHRDLKPENIFLVQRKGGETAKILDFGIARLAQSTHNLTGAGNIVGTPLYMSPEQCRGEGELTASTDLYSFGIMLFQMLMGHTPFQGDHPQKLLIDHFLVPAPALSNAFPEPLRKLQAELLAKTPEERPPDIEAVWRRLADALITTAPHHVEEKPAYDDGGDDDYTDLTATFSPLQDPNTSTVAVREVHNAADDFSRITRRSVEREETDIVLQRPAAYQTPAPLAPHLSIGEHDPNFEYDRQTMESLPAMTPEAIAKHTSSALDQQNNPHQEQAAAQEDLRADSTPTNDDTDGFRQASEQNFRPMPLSSPSLPSPTPSPDTDEELLKDLALYASSPTPASSSAWESATPPQASWAPNASSHSSKRPWEGEKWTKSEGSPRVHQTSDPSLDQLLEFSAPQMPENTNAQTEIHIAAHFDDDGPEVTELELDFNQYTQTELRAPNFAEDPVPEKQNKKNVFLIVLFLFLVGSAGIGLYVAISFFSTPHEVPPPPINQKHLLLVQKLQDTIQCPTTPKQYCVRVFSTRDKTSFSFSHIGSKKRIFAPSGQANVACFCQPRAVHLDLYAVLFGAEKKPIELYRNIHLKQQLLVVFDFDTQQTHSYPARFARKSQIPLPPLRPQPRRPTSP